jgi:hypothetical protein
VISFRANEAGAVAGLVGNEGGVVKVINLESSMLKRRTGDYAMTKLTTNVWNRHEAVSG